MDGNCQVVRPFMAKHRPLNVSNILTFLCGGCRSWFFFFFFLLFSFIGHFSQGIVNILLFFRNDTA